jgi:rRNA pseudouridine-1189 N-methylase Emg1 (Nep1/Mra1 family)
MKNQILLDLAESILNEEGQIDVEILLSEGNEASAREYLLGALERCIQDGDIPPSDATKLYKIINVPMERVLEIRACLYNGGVC